jgi:hypothetical protein
LSYYAVRNSLPSPPPAVGGFAEPASPFRTTIDVIIATWCVENRASLIHSDRDFELMQELIGLRTGIDSINQEAIPHANSRPSSVR